MRLDAYVLDGHELQSRPAPFERDWMDATGQRFAYRCLPLNIANAHGWELLCPVGFGAIWNGAAGIDGIHVEADGPAAPAVSHFGAGILTFHVPALIRTEPGFDLMAQGPINRPKDAIAPLSGLVETDWAPFTFTMNWQFTRPAALVRFEAGEPFCTIMPVRRDDLERFEPRLRRLSEDPALADEVEAWTGSRRAFNAALGEQSPEALRDGWQKHYYQGRSPTEQGAAPETHRTRVRLRPFAGSGGGED